MNDDTGRHDRAGTSPSAWRPGLWSEGGPWGGGDSRASGGDGDSGGDPGKDGEGRRNPWMQPPRVKPRIPRGEGQPSLEELIRRGRARFSGGMPGGLGGRGRPIWGYAIAAFLVLWVLTTAIHQIDPQQRGVITRFGRYVGTLKPGIGLTFPAPVDTVTRVNVEQIRAFDVPASGGQNLVLTGDQNIIDLAYSVRWSVRDPELYLFELADPEDTIGEVAESAMREEMSRVTLDQAIGPMRATIEARVAARMQMILDRYKAGVTIQGVAIKQADPPAAVNDAFKAVSASQQQAQADINNARSYSEQVTANAQAAASSFDKVYQAYKMAPDVTRRRMYYDTMEAVLAKTNKVIVDTPGANTYLPIPPFPRKKPAAADGAAPADGGQ